MKINCTIFSKDDSLEDPFVMNLANSSVSMDEGAGCRDSGNGFDGPSRNGALQSRSYLVVVSLCKDGIVGTYGGGFVERTIFEAGAGGGSNR